MKHSVAGLVVVLALSGLFTGQAEAKGCLKGAAVGAVAGHLAHRHAVLGAIAGCIVGHHLAHKHDHDSRDAKPHNGASGQY